MEPGYQTIHYPGSDLRFWVASGTESARIRKVKETWTVEWVRSLPNGAILYDIGANIGLMSLLACECRERRVRAVAIEPAYMNFSSLQRNIVANGLDRDIIALPIGLGEKSGVFPFRYQNVEAGGSMHSFGDIIPFKGRSTEPVLVCNTYCLALDDLTATEGIPFPTHIKIDVDGTELDILRGGREMLADQRLAELQVEAVDFTDDDRLSNEIIGFLAKFGFIVTDIFDHNDSYPLGRDFRFARGEAVSRA